LFREILKMFFQALRREVSMLYDTVRVQYAVFEGIEKDLARRRHAKFEDK
jgi:hypothetical protein